MKLLSKLVLVLWLALCAAPSLAHCNREVVGQAWSGTRVPFGAASAGHFAFLAYFNPDRRLVISKIDLATCVIASVSLSSTFNGWDSHDGLVLALDPQDRIHLAGNMHSDALDYFVSKAPLDIKSLAPAEMTGLNEESVTYPRFLRVDKKFYFMFREGRAGNGAWYINKWADGKWVRLMSDPVFASEFGEETISAYPSQFELGPRGFFHVAVVWQRGPTFNGNFRLSYAKTKDFAHWFDHTGTPLRTPLGPDSMDLVDDVGVNRGLMNNAKIAVADDGRPYVTYTKYSDDGKNGGYLAYPSRAGWRVRLLGESKSTTIVDPHVTRGSSRLPTISPLNFRSGRASVQLVFPNEPSKQIDVPGVYGQDQVAKPRVEADVEKDKNFAGILSKIEDPVFVTADTKADRTGPRFIWVTRAPHRAGPRTCRGDHIYPCVPPASPILLLTR